MGTDVDQLSARRKVCLTASQGVTGRGLGGGAQLPFVTLAQWGFCSEAMATHTCSQGCCGGGLPQLASGPASAHSLFLGKPHPASVSSSVKRVC